MLLVAVKIKHVTCFFFLIGVSLHYPQPPEFSGMSDEEYTEEGKCLPPLCNDKHNDSCS